MRKEIKIIIIAAVVLLFLLFGYLLIAGKKKNNQNSTNSRSSTETNIQKNYFIVPPTDQPKMELKTPEGNVQTENLYKNPAKRFSDDVLDVTDNEDYTMYFFPETQSIIISINNPEIQFARYKAEQELLARLGITKEEACKLNVDLGVPFSVNAEASGVNYGLSFCPNGKQFP